MDLGLPFEFGVAFFCTEGVVLELIVDAGGGTLVATGNGACEVDDAGFAFADLLVIGFDPEQNSQAQSPLSCESPINQRRWGRKWFGDR